MIFVVTELNNIVYSANAKKRKEKRPVSHYHTSVAFINNLELK